MEKRVSDDCTKIRFLQSTYFVETHAAARLRMECTIFNYYYKTMPPNCYFTSLNTHLFLGVLHEIATSEGRESSIVKLRMCGRLY